MATCASAVLALVCVSVSAAPSGLRAGTGSNSTTTSSERSILAASRWQHPGCCNGCGTAFCSPSSGTCYDRKGKYYYLECRSDKNGSSNSTGTGTGNSYANYAYAGRGGCTGQSSKISHFAVNSSSQCRDACQGNSTCRVFIYRGGWTRCGFGASCQLYRSCEPEENICWEKYVRD